MRYTGILVTLAALGYAMYVYLGSSTTPTAGDMQTKPAEYIDQAKQSADAINEAMKKQEERMKGSD